MRRWRKSLGFLLSGFASIGTASAFCADRPAADG
jgi:hypothetical protein